MMRQYASKVGTSHCDAAFLAFVLIAALRPMIAESYDSAGSPFSAALTQISDPTPVRTLALDLAILAASGAWLLGRRMENQPLIRFPAIEWSIALLALAAAISCIFAGQKRLAINGAVDWLCLPIFALGLSDLLRAPVRRRILLAAIIGAAVQQAAHGLDQYLTAQATWEIYENRKVEFWAAQGIGIDDGRVDLFERRALSREVQASFPHSNVAASYFLLCAFAAAGATLDRWRAARHARSPAAIFVAVACTILTAALIAILPLTGSFGAILAAVAGVLLWVLLVTAQTWIARHRRTAIRIGWAALLVSGAAFVGHGLYHGNFPHMSLTFRWQYWTAAAEMIADRPLSGVGRENFGRHYLQYKPISSPEEVSNPHSFLVQFAADWGVIGLAGAVALLVASVSALTRPRGNAPPGSPARGESENRSLPEVRGLEENPRLLTPVSARRALLWMFALVALLTLLRLPLLGTDNAQFLYYQSMLAALTFAAGFLAFALSTSPEKGPRDQGIGGSSAEPAQDFGHGAIAISVGLFVFLVHDLINFALFVPASATTLFAMVGFALSTRNRIIHPGNPLSSARADASTGPQAPALDATTSARHREANQGSACANSTAGARGRLRSAIAALRRTPPLPWLTGALFIAAIFLGLIPVMRSTSALAEARRLTTKPYPGEPLHHPAYLAFQRAADLDSFDATPLGERALWLFSLAESQATRSAESPPAAIQSLQLAADSAAGAIARDPHQLSLHRRLARIHSALAGRTSDSKDHGAAVAAAEAALQLYPESPESLILLADIERQAAAGMDAADLRARALDHYRIALEMDRTRPSWAQFNRLPNREVARVEGAIAELETKASREE